MMKKIIYICSSIFVLAFFSCQDENENDALDKGGLKINFSVNIPQFTVAKTKSVSAENRITDMWLLVFDANGLFLERKQASGGTNSESNGIGSGSFNAQVSNKASIIHFIANYDQWASFDDIASFQKDEREIIPALSGNSLVFWGRTVFASSSPNFNVTLYRNQAKITLENRATADNFTVTGFTLINYTTKGTVAPFNTALPLSPFVIPTIPTMPRGTVDKASQPATNCDMNPEYTFENENYYNDQTYIILKGKIGTGDDLYYKIQFLDANKQPYKIVRNNVYNIIIKSFSANANGTASFEDAKNAEPSNNIYAEILKESPSISDGNTVLSVSALNFLFIRGGTLSMTATYTVNGTTSNSLVSVLLVEDQGQILSNLTCTNGSITATVAAPVAGQKQASFVVKAGNLSRIITVTTNPSYVFTPVTLTPPIYTAKDEATSLSFTIPSSVPSYFFPLKCLINTKKMYPVSPNQNLQIEYVTGGFKYVYWATESGTKTLNFKTSFENSDETITVENDYFATSSVDLKARHFTNVSINSTTTPNIVSYATNAAATYRFTIADIAGSAATYPLTVTIATNNLKTTQAGWTAITGGYRYTFATAPTGVQSVAFTSSKAGSREKVSISATGFAPTTISFDNTLAANQSVTGNLRVLVNGSQISIPRSSIASSNTALVANFNSAFGSNISTYTFPIKSGAKLSDMLMFTVNYNNVSYTAPYTVEQLLAQPILLFQ